MSAPVRSCTLPARLLALLFGLAAALPHGALSQAAEPQRSEANLAALARVEVRTHVLPEAPGVAIPYGVFVPTAYDAGRTTPLVVALHGLGSDEMYMMEYSNLVELAERHGWLVVTPMGFSERGWYGSRGPGNDFNRGQGPANLGELSERDVMAVLEIMKRDYNVDERRIYLIGQSMGGGGTWYLGMKHADVWAALAPMAPAIYSSPDQLADVRDLPPIMVVMGDADELVDVEVTRSWWRSCASSGSSTNTSRCPADRTRARAASTGCSSS